VPEFVPGRELSRRFYLDAVRPILDAEFPGLEHSAALIGSGSEVLGFDTAMSRDHCWGPRVDLFLRDEDYGQRAEPVRVALSEKLPFEFRGYPTHFQPLAEEPGTFILTPAACRPVHHQVQVLTMCSFLREYAGLEPGRELTLLDWLAIPEQKLRTLATGAVYHDGLACLEALQRRLAWYPRDVWLYLLSAQWQRIGQEEPFVGRSGSVGDEAGSAVIAARLARDVMRLFLLMEKQYAPYSKWFGSAFARLSCAPRLTPILERAVRASEWRERQRCLADAYELAAVAHNDLGITALVQTQVRAFYDRPFLVIGGEDIARSIWDAIQDLQVRALPFGLGKVDQFVDSTDVLSHDGRCRAVVGDLTGAGAQVRKRTRLPSRAAAPKGTEKRR
jgi:hypothetical protein